jgi:hypothetical protein
MINFKVKKDLNEIYHIVFPLNLKNIFILLVGYDLIPENKDNYSPGSPYTANMNFKDSKKFAKEQIVKQDCRIPMDDGGAYHVQRMVRIHSI